MKIITTNNKSAPQPFAADINDNSTKESRQVAAEIKGFSKSRAALIRRRKFLKGQLAIVDKAMRSGVKPQKPGRYQTRNYGVLTAALKEELAGGPRSKRELVEQLQRRGIPLGAEPLKVVDSVIYTRHFQREKKSFSLATPSS